MDYRKWTYHFNSKQGVIWGQPRPGHSEGQVIYHIAEVLKNTDRLARTDEDRRALRLIALIHDSFKYRVDPTKPRFDQNAVGMESISLSPLTKAPTIWYRT